MHQMLRTTHPTLRTVQTLWDRINGFCKGSGEIFCAAASGFSRTIAVNFWSTVIFSIGVFFVT